MISKTLHFQNKGGIDKWLPKLIEVTCDQSSLLGNRGGYMWPGLAVGKSKGLLRGSYLKYLGKRHLRLNMYVCCNWETSATQSVCLIHMRDTRKSTCMSVINVRHLHSTCKSASSERDTCKSTCMSVATERYLPLNMNVCFKWETSAIQ